MLSHNWGVLGGIVADAQAHCSEGVTAAAENEDPDMALHGQWGFGVPSDSESEHEDHDLALQGQLAFGASSDSASAPGTPPAAEPLEMATPSRRVESRLYIHTYMCTDIQTYMHIPYMHTLQARCLQHKHQTNGQTTRPGGDVTVAVQTL